LRIDRPELLFLLRCQVFPGLHTAKDLLLAVLRHVVEMLQSLFISLLIFPWKTAELRIVPQRSFLLVERLSLMLIQPLSGVVSSGRRLIGSGNFILPWLLGLWLELRPRLDPWPVLRLRTLLIFPPVELRSALRA